MSTRDVRLGPISQSGNPDVQSGNPAVDSDEVSDRISPALRTDDALFKTFSWLRICGIQPWMEPTSTNPFIPNE